MKNNHHPNHLTIEPVTTADTADLLGIYAPYVESTAISFEYEPPTEAEFADRIRSISARYPYIKAVEGGETVGYAYANTFKGRRAYDWSVETTIYVRQDRHGQGIGRALYEALEKSLKDMGILNMNACIAAPKQLAADPHLSADSIHFHERMGFVPVGTFHDSGYKFDTWYDMIWMEKMIGQHAKEQNPVRFGDWTI